MEALRILIVEDDREASEELEAAVLRTKPEAVVDKAGDFETAMQLGCQVKYDLIFTDLLLLPDGVEVRNSRLIETSDCDRMLGPAEHRRFLNTEGGIGFVKSLRTTAGGLNVFTPIVVMTWYMEGDAYEAIESQLLIDGDPNIVMLPKHSRITELADSLDEETRSRFPSLLEPLQRLLDLCLDLPWTPEHAGLVKSAARALTKTYRITKAMGQSRQIRLPQAAGTMAYQSTNSVVCTLHVNIDPLGDSDSIVKLLGNTSPGSDELTALYDWPLLRDWVLLNPRIKVDLSITVRLVTEEEDLPIVELPIFRTSPTDLYGSGPTADAELADQLIERLILVFIAHHSEPPADRGDGLGITTSLLCQNLAAGTASGDEVDRPAGEWGVNGLKPDIAGALERIEKGVRASDKIQDVRAKLREAMSGYRGFIDGDALDLMPEQTKRQKSFWYFNGNMSLSLPEEEWHRPEGAEAQHVAFFLLSDEISFQCLGGRYAPPEELELRFREAGMTVERFTSLDQIADVPKRLPDATLAVVAPGDDALLDSFISGPARELWAEALPDGCPPTIIVLGDEVGLRSQEEMEGLRAAGIDCMYPSRIEGALDLTKIIDHVICAGYRTRYLAVPSGKDDPGARAAARPRLSAPFADLVERFGYDGDLFSGAASERLDDGRILVTASKTHKLSTDPDEVAVVEEMDVIRNVVTWAGVGKPSSSVRWHALIYDHLPWVRCILHTHWKDFTYSDLLASRTTPHYRLSGSRREAAEITGALAGGWPPASVAVLKDHGEVFVGEDWESVLALVAETREASLSAR